MANYGTNVPGNVIVNQPGALQPLLTLPDPMFPRGVGRPWSTGLCDCCNDCAICVLSTFIPCYICAMSKQMGESAIMPCCVHPSLLVMRSNFRGKHNIEYLSQCKPSLEQVHTIMRDMSHQVRQMFPGVEQLLRLILVSPASSCTAECSFSALRRIKTWLRNKMGQTRLNSLMGNLIDDCCTTTCCYLCAKCQLAREIQLIKYGHAAP